MTELDPRLPKHLMSENRVDRWSEARKIDRARSDDFAAIHGQDDYYDA